MMLCGKGRVRTQDLGYQSGAPRPLRYTPGRRLPTRHRLPHPPLLRGPSSATPHAPPRPATPRFSPAPSAAGWADAPAHCCTRREGGGRGCAHRHQGQHRGRRQGVRGAGRRAGRGGWDVRLAALSSGAAGAGWAAAGMCVDGCRRVPCRIGARADPSRMAGLTARVPPSLCLVRYSAGDRGWRHRMGPLASSPLLDPIASFLRFRLRTLLQHAYRRMRGGDSHWMPI